MMCPKCRREEMKVEKFNDIEIERCSVCKGVCLDPGELPKMLGLEVGTGDTFAFSPISDAMDAVAAHCSRCDCEMVAQVGDAEVRVDRCPKCGAMFLDQGELATLQLYSQ